MSCACDTDDGARAKPSLDGSRSEKRELTERVSIAVRKRSQRFGAGTRSATAGLKGGVQPGPGKSGQRKADGLTGTRTETHAAELTPSLGFSSEFRLLDSGFCLVAAALP